MRRVDCIHFVGIGGAGMGGIAEVLLNEGYKISGSDLGPNPVVERLTSLGAEIKFGHAAENIQGASVGKIQSVLNPASHTGHRLVWRSSGHQNHIHRHINCFLWSILRYIP